MKNLEQMKYMCDADLKRQIYLLLFLSGLKQLVFIVQVYFQLGKNLVEVNFLLILLFSVISTLESGIDVGQGINVGPGKFVKKNKRRAVNKHRA